MGLINTGVMILRNSAWTRDFLSRWWAVVDRNKRCDQDAFDVLYAQYKRGEVEANAQLGDVPLEDAIKILPMGALNSHPPAMLHQQSDSQVLHLMGESSAMRASAFKFAFKRVCDAVERKSPLEEQLGLNRSTLLSIARYG